MILDPQKVIISRRKARSRGGLLLSLSLPLIFFGGLAYLAQPLVAGAWERPEVLFALLGDCLPLVLGASFGLFLWAWYNRLRFGGGRDKRAGASPSPAVESMPADGSFPHDDLRRLRGAKVVTFFFDDGGDVVGFRLK